MKFTVDVPLTVEQLAEAFAGLNDERQAQFFVEVARIVETWPGGSGMQWWGVGRHLRTCECSTEEARDLVREIASAMDYVASAAENVVASENTNLSPKRGETTE